MTSSGTNRTYYLVSDLHIGGDEQLGNVDFLEELLGFLERLENTEENAELVINGDSFGLWETRWVPRPLPGPAGWRSLATGDVGTDRFTGVNR